MNKFYIFFIVLLCFSEFSFGQNEFEIYKKIYKTSDSLKSIGKISYMESDSLINKVKEIEKEHPNAFFELIDEYMIKSKFNEASFIYFIGLMRFGYYIDVNNNYNDRMLLNNMTNNYGGFINHYLRTNVDNYIFIIRTSVKYYIKNDFAFFSKNNNIEKYNSQIEALNDFVLDIEKNKEKYKKHWSLERVKIQKEIKKPKDNQSGLGNIGK